MSNNRTAPAYQEYAANIIARFEYRTLTLPQRGLLYSMRLECWVNQYLPESPSVLARILGFDVAEVAAEIPYVMPFFAVEDGRIYAPDLEAYRQHVRPLRRLGRPDTHRIHPAGGNRTGQVCRRTESGR